MQGYASKPVESVAKALFAIFAIAFGAKAHALVDYCPSGTECVGLIYTDWCYTFTGTQDCHGIPATTCPELSTASNTTFGVRSWEIELDVAIDFETCGGYTSGTGILQGTITPYFNGEVQQETGETQWSTLEMNFPGGGTHEIVRVLQSSRTYYCPASYQFVGEHTDLCRRNSPSVSARNFGSCPTGLCPLIGNPVNVAIANKVEFETDYEGAGPFPLTFKRT